jgi:hypothetical protein
MWLLPLLLLVLLRVSCSHASWSSSSGSSPRQYTS